MPEGNGKNRGGYALWAVREERTHPEGDCTGAGDFAFLCVKNRKKSTGKAKKGNGKSVLENLFLDEEERLLFT